MKKRIGNDIPIVWTLTDTEGNPYDLTGKEFSVCMKLEGMCVYIPMVYTFTENVISFTFYGKDQPGTGIYDLILREGDSEVTYDVQGVVELVPHSWDEDEGDITIESEIATNGEVNVIEVVKVNGVALPVVDKAVDITVPTDLADLAGDDTHRTVTDAEKVAWNAKYDKPTGGIPASDLASGVIPDVSDFVDEDEMTAALAGKQNTISDIDTIRSGAAAGATAYQKPSSGIPASDIASGVIPDVSQFITKSVNDLVNYYLKSETYTKAEVQALLNAVKQFTYESVATLPTASAETMHKIYLVPSADPQTSNVKDEYITIDNGATAQTRYTWEQIGSTAIDLSGYVTTSDLNTALASYTTTSDLTTLLAGKQDVIDAQHKLSYSLLSDTPTIPAAGIPSGGSAGQILAKNSSTNYDAKWVNAGAGGDVNVIEVVKVNGTALTPDANKAVDVPVPTALSQLSDDSTHRLVTDSEKTGWNNKSDFSGSYNDLTNKPTIPAAQVQSDWNATSGMGVILNKPTIPAAQVNSDWNASSGVAQILNKPTIPTVPTISTDISADATSNTKTASPKAVKDYVDANAGGGLPFVTVSAMPSGGFVDNRVYYFDTAVSGTVSWSFATPTDLTVTHIWNIIFFTDDTTAPQINFPRDVWWANGAPTFQAEMTYELNIVYADGFLVTFWYEYAV